MIGNTNAQSGAPGIAIDSLYALVQAAKERISGNYNAWSRLTPAAISALFLAKNDVGSGNSFSDLICFVEEDLPHFQQKMIDLVTSAGQYATALSWKQIQHYLFTELYVYDEREISKTPYWWGPLGLGRRTASSNMTLEQLLVAATEADQGDTTKLEALTADDITALDFRKNTAGDYYTDADMPNLRNVLAGLGLDLLINGFDVDFIGPDGIIKMTHKELQYYLLHFTFKLDADIPAFAWNEGPLSVDGLPELLDTVKKIALSGKTSDLSKITPCALKSLWIAKEDLKTRNDNKSLLFYQPHDIADAHASLLRLVSAANYQVDSITWKQVQHYILTNQYQPDDSQIPQDSSWWGSDGWGLRPVVNPHTLDELLEYCYNVGMMGIYGTPPTPMSLNNLHLRSSATGLKFDTSNITKAIERLDNLCLQTFSTPSGGVDYYDELWTKLVMSHKQMQHYLITELLALDVDCPVYNFTSVSPEIATISDLMMCSGLYAKGNTNALSGLTEDTMKHLHFAKADIGGAVEDSFEMLTLFQAQDIPLLKIRMANYFNDKGMTDWIVLQHYLFTDDIKAKSDISTSIYWWKADGTGTRPVIYKPPKIDSIANLMQAAIDSCNKKTNAWDNLSEVDITRLFLAKADPGTKDTFHFLTLYGSRDLETFKSLMNNLVYTAGKNAAALTWLQVQHYLIANVYVADSSTIDATPYWWKSDGTGTRPVTSSVTLADLLEAMKMVVMDEDSTNVDAITVDDMKALDFRKDISGTYFAASERAVMRAKLVSLPDDVLNEGFDRYFFDEGYTVLTMTWKEVQYYILHGSFMLDAEIADFVWTGVPLYRPIQINSIATLMQAAFDRITGETTALANLTPVVINNLFFAKADYGGRPGETFLNLPKFTERDLDVAKYKFEQLAIIKSLEKTSIEQLPTWVQIQHYIITGKYVANANNIDPKQYWWNENGRGIRPNANYFPPTIVLAQLLEVMRKVVIDGNDSGMYAVTYADVNGLGLRKNIDGDYFSFYDIQSIWSLLESLPNDALNLGFEKVFFDDPDYTKFTMTWREIQYYFLYNKIALHATIPKFEWENSTRQE